MHRGAFQRQASLLTLLVFTNYLLRNKIYAMTKKSKPMLKEATAPNNNHGSKKYMKMRELAEATGVNSATIRYYINEGLLPRPYKTHKNMAYYDELYIDLIVFIKKLQKEHFLPLEVIKEKLNGIEHKVAPCKTGEAFDRLTREDHNLQSPGLQEASGKKLLTQKELLGMTRLSQEDFEAALESGFISQDAGGLIDSEYLEIAVFLSGLSKDLSPDKSLAVDFFTMHLNMVEDLVSKEVRSLIETRGKNGTFETEVKDNVHKAVNLFYKVAPVIHKRLLAKKIKDKALFV